MNKILFHRAFTPIGSTNLPDESKMANKKKEEGQNKETETAEKGSKEGEGTAMAHCEDKLGQTKTAAMVDGMGLGQMFQLGIGIGCGHSTEKELAIERLDAALTAIIEVIIQQRMKMETENIAKNLVPKANLVLAKWL
jgi:hypothetical protein